MTIFKIDTDKLKADALKDKELEKMVTDFRQMVKVLQNKLGEAKVYILGARKTAGQIYKRCDEKMKDKSLTPEQKKQLTELRKQAYDLGMSVKVLAANVK